LAVTEPGEHLGLCGGYQGGKCSAYIAVRPFRSTLSVRQSGAFTPSGKGVESFGGAA
jgi:hypothetical protein